MRMIIRLLFLSLFFYDDGFAQVHEPYKPLHGGNYSSAAVQASPDPLIRYCWTNPKAADSLQLYVLQPKKISGNPASAFTQTEHAMRVNGKGSLMFDFGMENAGWIEFESDDLTDSVEMSISEYNEPAVVNAGAQNPVKTKAPTKYGHTYRLELNDGLYEGVRFAWIHVTHFTKPWHIKNVRLICQVKPVNYQGRFYCNDTMLNRIWYTGAYVVKLNMLQDYFGAILMERSDRHSWTGDAYPAQAAALAAFGNYDVVKKNIEFTADQDNGIAAYSVYWVLSLIDYYNYTGDSVFLKAYMANADRRLQKAYNEFDTLPMLGFMGWDERLGAGFENTQIQEAQNTYRMLCINGFKQFAKAMASANETQLATKYTQFAEAKTAWIMKDKKSLIQYGVHAVSEAINAGLGDEPTINKLSQQLFADRINRLSYSPFNQYFIIQAMALAKQNSIALTTIRDNWGGQIAYGGTSFFEVYRPSWNGVLNTNDAPPNNQCGYTSLAHPWGAGVTKWLSENVLGIEPLLPGFKAFSIIPFLQAGLTQVNGTMPTPFGLIKAAFNAASGECEITVPHGTVATVIGLPKSGRQISKLVVNNKQCWSINTSQPIDTNRVGEDGEYVYLKNIQAGSYKIIITYSGEANVMNTTVEPFNYAITYFTQDSLTSGNWQDKYGKDGYVLLGNANNANTKKLPTYIDSITHQKNSAVVWDSLSSDNRVLQSPTNSTRLASAIITRDPEATNQTMTIEVICNDNQPHKISLYFLDFDKKDRRSAIEIFDLKTLNIIAPVQMLKHYENGKYLGFSFDKSIRIRVNQVRGTNAAVSGIFFDKSVQ